MRLNDLSPCPRIDPRQEADGAWHRVWSRDHAGRGTKGQKARTSGGVRPGFELLTDTSALPLAAETRVPHTFGRKVMR